MLSYLFLFSPSEDIAWRQPLVSQKESPPSSWAELACTSKSWTYQHQELWDIISVAEAIQIMLLCSGSLCGLIHDGWSKQRWTRIQTIVWVSGGLPPLRQMCRVRLSTTGEREREAEVSEEQLEASFHGFTSTEAEVSWETASPPPVLLLCFHTATLRMTLLRWMCPSKQFSAKPVGCPVT